MELRIGNIIIDVYGRTSVINDFGTNGVFYTSSGLVFRHEIRKVIPYNRINREVYRLLYGKYFDNSKIGDKFGV